MPGAPHQSPLRYALLLGLVMTAFGLSLFCWVREMETDTHRGVFDAVFQSHRAALELGIDKQEAMLASLRAAFRANPDLSRDAFAELVGPWLRLYPEVQSLQWVPLVTGDARARLERAARRDGIEGFQFSELDDDGAAVHVQQRERYFPGYFVEPYLDNEGALGFDWGTEPDVLSTLERAWSQGTPAATRPLPLHAADGAPGVMIVVPVYRRDSLSFTASGRRQGLLGFVVGSYRLDAWPQAVLRQTGSDQIRLALDDRDAPLRPAAFRHRTGGQAGGTAALGAFADVAVAGRVWRLSGRPSAAFGSEHPHAASWLVLLATLLLVPWLAGFGYRRARELRRVERLVDERTGQLQEQAARLRRSLDTNAAILEAMPVGVITCDGNRRIRHANSAALRLLGRDRRDVIGSGCREIGICSLPVEACPHLGDFDTFGAARQSDHLLHRAGSEPIAVLKTVAPIMIDDEPVLLEAFVDVTPLKDTQQRLALEIQRGDALNRLLRRSLSCRTPAALLLEALDILQGLAFVASESGAAFLADPVRDELTLIEARGFSPQLRRRCARVPFGHCLCGRAALDGKGRLGYTTDPEHENRYPGMLPRSFYNIPVQGDAKVAGMLVLYLQPGAATSDELTAFMDAVSATLSIAMQRLLMEQKLEHARVVAEAASAAKSRFLAAMSHELRTPMNGVLGMAELLSDTELSADQQDFVRTIGRCGHELLQMVDQVLDFSELDRSPQPPVQRELDLDALLRRSLSGFESAAAERGLELRLVLEEGCRRRFLGDADRLSRLLSLLLGNAVKFTPSGSVTLSATCRDDDSGAVDIELGVTDTGIGIPPERLPDLFQPFTQLDASLTRQYGGAGLGLALARRIVELMGGRIGVDSEPGRGSRFWVRLSLPVAAAPGARPLPGGDARAPDDTLFSTAS